jgi:glutamyl-tRNA reductase
LGNSYRTAPFDVLERLALNVDEVRAVLEHLSQHDAITDAMIVSTCNRTEIYTSSLSSASDVFATVTGALREVAGAERFPGEDHLYRSRGRDSVQHLFRVACGLDSMVLGETQILGQVKEAYEQSRGLRQPTAYFDQVLQSAFKVARSTRAATEIGKGAVSVASAAVHLASRIYSDLSRHTVVVVGAGDTGRLAAEHFSKHGPGRLIVLNRTLARAEEVARQVKGEAMPLEQLPVALLDADIVACAVGVKEPVLSHDLVSSIMSHRGGQPLAIFDLGLPRNAAAEVGQIANVFLNDLDALKQVVDSNLARRRKEVPRVEELIQKEIDAILDRQRVLQAGPLIAALRESVERVRRAEVERVAAKLSEAEREAVDRATRAVVNKLLHGPTTSIKTIARQQEEGSDQLELIGSLFGGIDGDRSKKGS